MLVIAAFILCLFGLFFCSYCRLDWVAEGKQLGTSLAGCYMLDTIPVAHPTTSGH